MGVERGIEFLEPTVVFVFGHAGVPEAGGLESDHDTKIQTHRNQSRRNRSQPDSAQRLRRPDREAGFDGARNHTILARRAFDGSHPLHRVHLKTRGTHRGA